MACLDKQTAAMTWMLVMPRSHARLPTVTLRMGVCCDARPGMACRL